MPIQVTRNNVDGLLQRCHRRWMEEMGIVKGEKGALMQEVAFLALAFGGEAGELQNLVKKIWRDGLSPELLAAIRKEVADCLIYLKHLADAFEIDEEVAVIEKTQELVERWPDKFQ